MRWAGQVACLKEMRNPCILNGKLEGKRPFRRHNRGWNNIKLGLNEMRYGDVD